MTQSTWRERAGTPFTCEKQPAQGPRGMAVSNHPLASAAGLEPAAVIVEILNDDGSMARRPDLERFARDHGIKIGTIADLIEHRSRVESLIKPVGSRTMKTAYGEFTAHAFKDSTGQGVHLALASRSGDDMGMGGVVAQPTDVRRPADLEAIVAATFSHLATCASLKPSAFIT